MGYYHRDVVHSASPCVLLSDPVWFRGVGGVDSNACLDDDSRGSDGPAFSQRSLEVIGGGLDNFSCSVVGTAQKPGTGVGGQYIMQRLRLEYVQL